MAQMSKRTAKSSVKPAAKPRPLCFVIGPIGKDGTELRKHADLMIHAVIKYVLESAEFGYQVKRADEDADPGMIGDRAVADILRAELVVADLTDLNPNAFYELGIRHATEKPTVHVARFGTMLPFDNISHRTIFIDLSDWHSIEIGRLRLSDSVRTIKDPSFRVTNPITQANSLVKLRESGDPRDLIISELQERLSSIESRVSDSEVLDSLNNAALVNGLHVFVETKDIFGIKGRVLTIKINSRTTVGEFLDEVYFELNSIDDSVKAYRYNKLWFVEKGDGSKVISSGNHVRFDARLLSSVGIYPNSTLRVKPGPHWRGSP